MSEEPPFDLSFCKVQCDQSFPAKGETMVNAKEAEANINILAPLCLNFTVYFNLGPRMSVLVV